MKVLFAFIMTAALALFALSCAAPAGGRSSNVPPKRIVSLSPSLTAEIIDLGARDAIVGITTFQPPVGRKVAVVGSLINPSIEKIVALRPDLVVLSEEDGAVQNVPMLNRLDVPTRVFARNDAYPAIRDNYLLLARVVGREREAMLRLGEYRARLDSITHRDGASGIAFFVSYSPLVTVSGRSFMGAVIRDAGGRNVYEDISTPFPLVSMESLVARNPDMIVIMRDGSENDFMRALARYGAMKAVAAKRVYTVDPDDVSHYTPACYVRAAGIIADLIERSAGEAR